MEVVSVTDSEGYEDSEGQEMRLSGGRELRVDNQRATHMRAHRQAAMELGSPDLYSAY